jgi:hypothetical protein
MKAQPGRTYALIVEGRVRQVFTADQMLEWHDGLQVVEITDLNPQPTAGAYYRDGMFYPDPGPAPSEYHYLAADYTWQPLDAATVDQMKTSRATSEFEAKIFKAKCLSDLAFRLGKPPGQLTAAEIAAERDRLVAIYKNI